MRRFNAIFLLANLAFLAGVLYIHFSARSRERERFELLKPVLMKTYRDFNMKLPHEDPKNLDELLAPLESLTRGLSK